MINRVVKSLVAYDFIASFALGLLIPIFSVFVIRNIDGGTLTVAGLAFSFYWIARVLTVTPLSHFLDRTDGERDEYYFMIIGTILLSTSVLFFIWARLPWHIYLIQAVLGVSNSMAVPGWRILFTDHIDKGKVGLEWSFDDVSIGLSTAISAYVGALLADKFGFRIVFIILATLGYASTLFLIPIRNKISHKPRHKDKLKTPVIRSRF